MKNLFPFNLLTALTLKDDNGAPWVPSRLTSFFYVPCGALLLGAFFELTNVLFPPSNPEELEISIGRALFRLFFMPLACYYIFILPNLSWNRRATIKQEKDK